MNNQSISLFPVSTSSKYHDDLDKIRACYKLMREMALFTDLEHFKGINGATTENYDKFVTAVIELSDFLDTQVPF